MATSAQPCPSCGTAFPAIEGVPVLISEPDLDAIDLRVTGGPLPRYDVTDLGIDSVDAALRRGDRILEIGAGLEITSHPQIFKTDAFVYDPDHLDAVADAHALPFADGSFDFVFSLAVFEHLHSPWLAAAEIARVLRPGGRAFTLCAFFQPLHGYPDHYFNATESGLQRLFDPWLRIDDVGPSRHSTHRESAVPLHRMREMAESLDTKALPWRARIRRRRLIRSLWTASHQFQQLGDQLISTPAGFSAWRDIAPSVELLATKTSEE